MMKVYFACSIRGGREDRLIYSAMVKEIKKLATVLSEIFSDLSLTDEGHTGLSDTQIWERDMQWLKDADAVIAEVSTPSLGVGYEIARAEAMQKPLLVLYQKSERKLSAMIAGAPSVKTVAYENLGEAINAINEFILSLS